MKQRVYGTCKTYSMVSREALCEVLRIHNVDSKLLIGISSMYINNLTSVGVRGCEIRFF